MMALPTRHAFRQGRVVASLGGTAFAALMQRLNPARGKRTAPAIPGEELVETIPPRSPDLVRDYLRHVGGDPAAYKGTVPAHLFPQWGFPLAARTLRGIPYPMLKVLNGGCRLEIHRPLPADEPLEVRARLEEIDDDGRRAVLRQRVITGTSSAPDAVVADLYAIVPLVDGGRRGANGSARLAPAKKEAARVPIAARELAYWKLGSNAGLAFAMLTGDFNPVHWIRPYAKAFGFRSTILHGFATMARAFEGIQRSLYAGAVDRIRTFDVKFTRPLTLPARVGLYVQGDQCFVGDAPGGPAYLVGRFETKELRS